MSDLESLKCAYNKSNITYNSLHKVNYSNSQMAKGYEEMSKINLDLANWQDFQSLIDYEKELSED